MMMKKLTLLLVMITCLTSAAFADGSKINLTDEEKVWLSQHPVINIGTMNDWPPLDFVGSNGEPQGIGAAYIAALDKRLDGSITIHPAPFRDNYEKVQQGKLDALMDISEKPERKDQFNFTKPYISIPHVIVGRKGGKYFNSEEDLSGKTVALERGFYNVIHFRKNYPNVIVREYASTSDAIDAVARGEADAYAGNRAATIYLIEKELLSNLQLMGKLQGPRSVLQIGVAKNQPLLASILDKTLQSIPDDEQHAIYNKWVGLKYEKGTDYALLWKVVGASMAVILLFLLWNRQLGKEIRIRKRAEEELTEYRDGLEELVRERTKDLEKEMAERLRSEQAAIASEQRFGALFQNLADPVYISDMSGNVVAANAQASQELGYSNEELLTKRIMDLDANDTTPEILSERFKKLSGAGTVSFETIHRRKDGSQLPVEVNIRLIDFNGQPSVMGVARNVSGRKNAEELLKASEENYRCIAELTSDYIHKCSKTGSEQFRLQWMGGAIGTISGYNIDEMHALGCWLPLVHPDDREMVSTYLFGLVPGDVKQIEFRLVTKQKDIRWISERSLCESGTGEGELIVYGAATDITERKLAEEERQSLEQQMLHAQKLESLGVLAGGIAHDFNNILTAIIGNADLALMRINKESPVVDNLHRIEQAAARAADLAKQMLAYSGKGKFFIEDIDLNILFEEMLHMLEVSISKKAVLRFNPHQHLPTVEADITQIRQIIMNLVINASEAIGEKSGVIAITTGCMDCDRNYLKDVWLDENLQDGLYVYLEIADSGCGMDKETLSKLFDPFFTTKFTGRGLGMAAVLGIVRGHKGAIKVYSEPRRGTTFKILLPASGRPAEIFNCVSHANEWQGSGTVLLVDDEESVRGIGTEMLKELGFTTVTANDGKEALEIFKSTPDIVFVILDLTMPHMDGEQCFRELRQLKPDINVIMSSGYNEQEVTQKFAGKGLAGFIQKPYRLSTLLEVIRNIAV